MELPADFVEFWRVYPRRVGKSSALRAWRRLRPPLERIKVALAWQMGTDEWSKEGGAFIPHPATYLNAGRWEDERPAPRLSNGKGVTY